MAKVTFQAPEAAPEIDDIIEVVLLKNYVPLGTKPDSAGVYFKELAGTTVAVPRTEARVMLRAGIAHIPADLV